MLGPMLLDFHLEIPYIYYMYYFLFVQYIQLRFVKRRRVRIVLKQTWEEWVEGRYLVRRNTLFGKPRTITSPSFNPSSILRIPDLEPSPHTSQNDLLPTHSLYLVEVTLPLSTLSFPIHLPYNDTREIEGNVSRSFRRSTDSINL